MKVWILVREEQEFSAIEGVFDSEDKAYAKAKELRLRFFSVDEREVQ
jgi:hypothetical protein